jgi:CNT family concentrative nucleoside transporter
MLDVFRGLIGLAAFIGFLWIFSSDRKRIDWRLVLTGLVFQIIIGLAVLKLSFVAIIFDSMTQFFIDVLGFADDGGRFVFGDLYDGSKFGFIFAVRVVPTIIFFSALTSVLYYLGILQKIVWTFAWVMQKAMRLSGAESLAAAANVFVGQTEAPLVIKPYVERMTRSELLCLMTGGMATIAGGVFAGYVGFLGGDDEALRLLYGKHLLTASILSAPAAILCAKMLLPQTEEVDPSLDIEKDKLGANAFDAAMIGTTQGMYLAFNVVAALITFTAMIYLANYVMAEYIGEWLHLNQLAEKWTDGAYASFDLNFLFGLIFAPVAWLIGVDMGSLMPVGQLLGQKLILSEFVAYGTLSQMQDSGLLSDQRAIIIVSYALCGFANFASIGIQIGGISVLAPGQRTNLTELALRSVLGGTIACLMTACVAGMLI